MEAFQYSESCVGVYSDCIADNPKWNIELAIVTKVDAELVLVESER